MSAEESSVRSLIEDAIEVEDALEGLLERAAENPASAFDPHALACLSELRREDRAGFEALRLQLKERGVRLAELDRALTEGSGNPLRGAKQADVLVQLAAPAELFHVADGTGYADLRVAGHRETWPIRSKGFRRWLTRRFFEETKGAPNSEALQSALNVIEACAHYGAPRREVHLRVAGAGDSLYLDLGDQDWRAVEISPNGWRVVDEPPVRFRRAPGMQPLPLPVAGGSVQDLRSFLNVGSDQDFVLVVAWALAVLRNKGPYPVLVLSGEQGSAKSTFSAVLRKLLDPNSAPLRALPREDRDLFIAANNGHVLTFDNISGLPGWISDTLCRLATGGGFAVRQLYTDQDEVLFDAERPVILNGIEDFVARPDLADRAILLTLEPIPDEKRRSERELWAAFEPKRPLILGALLDAAVAGLRKLPETRLARPPRMADFAEWATACEGALWPSGTFVKAYADNRDDAIDGVIDSDPVALAVRALVTGRAEWTGTASHLLSDLAAVTDDTVKKSRSWPQTPRTLSNRLRRAATFLRKRGIDIGFDRTGHGRSRTITIFVRPDYRGQTASAPSASSAPESPMAKFRQSDRHPTAGLRTMADAKTGDADDAEPSIVRTKPAESLAADDADEADDDFPTQSAGWRARV